LGNKPLRHDPQEQRTELLKAAKRRQILNRS
jgi:hypothetical protein